ncbi:MAG: type II secretion system protein [Alphaproteobacteria bacterium]
MPRSPRNKGFSLLELSIVIIVVALVAGMGFSATLGLLETAKYKATEEKMNAIEEALMAFRTRYNRLPCPAFRADAVSNATYGYSMTDPGICGSAGEARAGDYSMPGAVPARTLGLPDSYMYDGWGRRFDYMVDVNATQVDAFKVIKPDEFCEIGVYDASGASFTGNTEYANGAIYSLVSFGPNGHGGYTEANTRVSSGSTDVSELKNCRCTSSAADSGGSPQLVRKEATATFDDIVRFKERWQMLTTQDVEDSSIQYIGPDLVIGVDQNGSNNVKLFERQCGHFVAYPGGLPTAFASTNPTLAPKFLGNKTRLFAYNDGSGTSCRMYEIAGRIVGPAVTGSVTCPAYSAATPMTTAAISRNGYLVVTKTAAPYVEIWNLDDSFYTPFPSAAPAVILDPALGGMPSKIEISENGEYLMLTRSQASTYTYLYRRDGQKYVRMTAPGGGGAFPVPTTAAAFTDDERKFALAIDGSPSVKLYTINPATSVISYVATIAAGLTTNTEILDFSSDGIYLAHIGGEPIAGESMDTKLNFYHFQSTTPTLIPGAGAFAHTGAAFVDAKFSPDGYFFITTYTQGVSDHRADVYRKTSATEFTYLETLTYTLSAGEEPSYIDFAD